MFLHSLFFACLFLFVGLKTELANTQVYRKVGNKILPYSTLIVDPSGYGNFTTIQSAIDSVPSNNKHWTSINVKAGTYRGKIKIDKDKPYIMPKGAGKWRIVVEWDDHFNTFKSATSISFRNSCNNPINNIKWEPAVAAIVSGDKTYFIRVGTLCGMNKEDTTTSFVPYKVLLILSLVMARLSLRYITNGRPYLGRAWRPYARVLFYYKKIMTNVASEIEECLEFYWS